MLYYSQSMCEVTCPLKRVALLRLLGSLLTRRCQRAQKKAVGKRMILLRGYLKSEVLQEDVKWM